MYLYQVPVLTFPDDELPAVRLIKLSPPHAARSILPSQQKPQLRLLLSTKCLVGVILPIFLDVFGIIRPLHLSLPRIRSLSPAYH